MKRLNLAFLGAIQVTLAGAPVTDLRYDKLRALLSFLAVEGERPQRREALTGLLWPDLPEDGARANLRQALASLRTAIGDRTAQPPLLLITRESVGWNPAADAYVDVAAFEELLRAARRHAHHQADECRQCAQWLAQAVELYRGSFLAQFSLPDSGPFEQWAVTKRENLQRQAQEALARLVSYHARQGEYEQAERYVRRQLEIEPWDESAHRQLMRLLAAGGRRTQALTHYEQCRRLLWDELSVEPEAETVALFEQIQLQREDAPQAAAISPAAAEPRPHLPPQPTPFVGREAELREIAALLANPACRLLTLTGAGGIGKTRLALQVATMQLGVFADGVFFVSLAAVDSVNLLVAVIAEVIGCPLHSQESAKAQLLKYLRLKTLLLVLDNFEHLLAGADLLAEIRAAAPAVRLLVTSRERLALQGEWIFTVHGLSYPLVGTQPDATKAELAAQYSAMHLFLQTAMRLQPGLALTPAETASITRICQLVEGMPLAIELAAAWMRVLSPQEIALEIERSLTFLAVDLRDVPERHRSLRAVFEHSWQLLAPREQDVFRKLAVFRGGCERAAAEQVAGASLPLLAALVDKSLLRRTAAGRYELHEHLRQYGMQKLEEAGQTEATADRHLAYFLSLAETAEPHLQEAHSTAWLDRLQAEHDNLRAALSWSLAGGSSEGGLRLAAALWVFWWVRGHTGEGRAWLAALLAPNGSAPPTQRARALRAAGALAYYQADLLAAEQQLRRALALFQEVGDLHGISRALRNLSVVLGEQSKFAEARAYAEESLALARTLGDKQNLANVLSDLGVLDYFLGDCARALPYLEESLALNRSLDDQHDIAIRLHNLAEVLGAMGDYARALQLYAESLALFRAAENDYGVAFTLQAQGNIYCAQGAVPQAQALMHDALALFRKLGDRQGMGLALLGLAGATIELGQLECAARLLGALDHLLAEKSVTFKPPDVDRCRRMTAAVRAQLPPEQFAPAWEAGRQLSLEDALDRASAAVAAEHGVSNQCN